MTFLISSQYNWQKLENPKAKLTVSLAGQFKTKTGGGGVGGGGGFFLVCKDLGGRFDKPFPTCTFFFKWRLAHAHQFHLLDQDQSMVAQ